MHKTASQTAAIIDIGARQRRRAAAAARAKPRRPMARRVRPTLRVLPPPTITDAELAESGRRGIERLRRFFGDRE